MHRRAVYVAVVTVVALYVGFGGWTEMMLSQEVERLQNREPDEIGGPVNLEGASIDDLDQAELFLRLEKIGRIWPWVFWFPGYVVTILEAAAFGALGGVGRTLKKIVLDKETWENAGTYATPLFGSILAMILVLLSYVVPLGVTTGEDIELRPLSVVIISFLGGMFSRPAYAWVECQARKLFLARNRET